MSRITGIPADTIRTWERRYHLVEPDRDASGRRSYSQQEVERLRLVALLAAEGERVADLAQLSSEALTERVRLHHQEGLEAPSVVRALVLHPSLGARLGGLDERGRTLEIVGHGQTPVAPRLQTPPDVLVVDLQVLGPAEPAAVLDALRRELDPRFVVLTYHFMSRKVRRALDDSAIRLVQGPLPVAALRQLVLDHAARPAGGRVPDDEVAPPRFARAQLERLMELQPDLLCECPNHLASLVLALREFELYSARCESRDDEDARLHGDLARGTGHARAALEKLLVRVCEHDGIVP